MAIPGSITLLFALVSLFVRLAAAAGSFCPAPCECPHTQRVLCANRGLGAVPRALPDPSAAVVRVLVLAGNFIRNVTGSDFTRYAGLRSLDLQFNVIEFLHPDAFNDLHELEELYLGNNLISHVQPGTLRALKRVTVLYCNNNAITELRPDSLGHLSSLVKLRLDKNDIEVLDESAFKRLHNLVFLHLESNQLRHIHPSTFSGLAKLQFLNLSDNEQTELRDVLTFSRTRSLVTLLLAGNQIRYVDDHVFHNLRKLTTLSLSKNEIVRFGREALKGLTHLKELALNSNRLTEIQAGLLDPLERLEHLDLGDNRIEHINPTAFGCLARLKALNLRNNRLASLTGGVFASNVGLFDLNLSGNNWTCDCRVEKLRSWMVEARSQGKLQAMSVRCRHPPTLEGKYLENVNDTQLRPQGNWTSYCESESDPREELMESRRTKVVESLVLKEDRLKRGGESSEGAGVKTEKDEKSLTQSRKRKKGASPRSRFGDPSMHEKSGASSALTASNVTKPLMREDGDLNLEVPSSEPVNRGQFDMLQQQQDKTEHYKARTTGVVDACQFNRHYILNVSVDNIGHDMATVYWRIDANARPAEGKDLLFRVLFDRFGHSVRFPRYVYTGGTARAVTLHELRPDSTYITCVESVVGGALCQVAPRDHCAGFVTSSVSETIGELDLRHVTGAALLANALLLLLVGGVWLGRALRRRIQSRKSAAHTHVRHMYSTRRPFRSAVGATCVSSDFSGYQSGRPLAEEGDLIQFPSDRFFDSGSARRDDDVIMPRFSD